MRMFNNGQHASIMGIIMFLFMFCVYQEGHCLYTLISSPKNFSKNVIYDYSHKSSVSAMLNRLRWQSLQQCSHHDVNLQIDIPGYQLIPSRSSTRGTNQKFLVPSTRTRIPTSQTPSACGICFLNKLLTHQASMSSRLWCVMSTSANTIPVWEIFYLYFNFFCLKF